VFRVLLSISILFLAPEENGLPVPGVPTQQDRRARRAEYIGTLPPEAVEDTIEKAVTLLR
jgi:hypothetical protein